MKRVAWFTDLHFEFADPPERADALCRKVAAEKPDAVLVGGDTGTAHDVRGFLRRIEGHFACPVYFVLGNHDFYEGSIAGGRRMAARLHRSSARLRWLPLAGVTELTPRAALVGHDGWADGRLGLGDRSSVMLNDYALIDELRDLPSVDLFRKLRRLGERAAAAVRPALVEAVSKYEQVLFLTHAPPFREASWYAGRVSDDEHLPHFTCHAVGEVLLEVARAHPGARLTVLCGHTHGEGESRPLPNLLAKTGGARYGAPRLQEMLRVE